MTFKAKMTAMAAILAAAGVMAQAQAAEVYNVGSNMAFAPFEYVDENNQPAGFEMELIVAIAKAQGAEVKLHNVPFDGLIPSLQTGAIDIAMSGITITDQRKRRVLFSTPYYQSGLAVMVREADKGKYTTIDSVKGKTLCAQIGTTGAITARKFSGKNVKEFNNAPETFMELQSGGCDAVVHDKPVMDYYMARRGTKGVYRLPETLSAEDYGIAVAKNNQKLVDWVNAGLEKIKASGEYDKIYTKWFGAQK